VGKRWRAYFELMRFPAVFTVVADVTMGWLVTRGSWNPWFVFALLVFASSCLYLAGMVLNDVYDAEIDARERPERPIPSGRISRAAASRLGWVLLVPGLAVVWLLSVLVGSYGPGVIGSILAILVWLYNAVAKRSPFAPIAMASCRFLNVVLAMCLATFAPLPLENATPTTAERAIGLGVFLYIAGATWFARTEARSSDRWHLAGGMLTMLVGLFCYWASPILAHSRPAFATSGNMGWAVLWIAIGAVILRRCALAVVAPKPHAVQNAVRTALRSLIVIDAAVVLGFCGPLWGCAVLVLLAPMLLLESWASTT